MCLCCAVGRTDVFPVPDSGVLGCNLGASLGVEEHLLVPLEITHGGPGWSSTRHGCQDEGPPPLYFSELKVFQPSIDRCWRV